MLRARAIRVSQYIYLLPLDGSCANERRSLLLRTYASRAVVIFPQRQGLLELDSPQLFQHGDATLRMSLPPSDDATQRFAFSPRLDRYWRPTMAALRRAASPSRALLALSVPSRLETRMRPTHHRHGYYCHTRKQPDEKPPLLRRRTRRAMRLSPGRSRDWPKCFQE